MGQGGVGVGGGYILDTEVNQEGEKKKPGGRKMEKGQIPDCVVGHLGPVTPETVIPF